MRLAGLVVLVFGAARASFIVSEGNCFVDNECVHSPNWPQDYSHDVECTFRPAASGWLNVVSFDLEGSNYWGGTNCPYDHLTVLGTQYCDDIGPQGVAVTPNTTMTFVSDYSVSEDGFQICLSSASPSPSSSPTSSPTIGECDDGSTHFAVTEGNCTACRNCFYSPNHVSGHQYHHDHACTITPLQSGWLDVEQFNVEAGFAGCR